MLHPSLTVRSYPELLMSRILISAAVALLCAAASPAAFAEKPRSAEMVCRYEQSTGSHIKKRSCATRAAREEQAKRDQKEMERLTRATPSGPSTN
jgi:hypothetical protein